MTFCGQSPIWQNSDLALQYPGCHFRGVSPRPDQMMFVIDYQPESGSFVFR